MMDDSALKTGEGRSLHLQGASRRTSGNHVERKPEEKANGRRCCCCNSGPVLGFNASASGRRWRGEEADEGVIWRGMKMRQRHHHSVNGQRRLCLGGEVIKAPSRSRSLKSV